MECCFVEKREQRQKRFEGKGIWFFRGFVLRALPVQRRNLEILGGDFEQPLVRGDSVCHIRGFRKLQPFPSSKPESEKVYKNCEHGGLCLDINTLIALPTTRNMKRLWQLREHLSTVLWFHTAWQATVGLTNGLPDR